MKLSVVSGGFDPLHIGHLELLERSAAIADKLFVIVNTDQFLANKKGKPFMPLRERMMIVQALKPVNLTIKSIDEDHTVCASLKFVNEMYRNKFDKIMFCNGGDRTDGTNTPEHKLCEELGIERVYGLGDKVQIDGQTYHGVYYAMDEYNKDLVSKEMINKVTEAEKKILTGAIKVPEK